MTSSENPLVRLKGKLVRPYTKAAGDRHSEAKAKLEAESGHKPAEGTVDATEHDLRHDYRDIDENQ